MAFIKSCATIRSIFMKIYTNHQIRLIEKLVHHPKFRGYAYHIHCATYCYDNNGMKQRLTVHHRHIVSNSDGNITDNRKKKANTENGNLFSSDFRDSLEILQVDFHNMKVDYDILVNVVHIYAEFSSDVDYSVGIFLLKCCGEVLPDVKHEVRQGLAEQIWKILMKKNPQPTLTHYHTYLDICVQNFATIEPEQFINNMKVFPDDGTYKYLLNVVARNGNTEGVEFVMMQMKEKNCPINRDTFRALIELCARQGVMKSVESLFQQLNLSGVTKLEEFHGEVAVGYAIQNDLENVLRIVESHAVENHHLLLIAKILSLSGKKSDMEKILKLIPREKMIIDPLLHNIVIELVFSNKLDEALIIVNYFCDHHPTSKTISLTSHFLRAVVRARHPKEIVLGIGRKFYNCHLPYKVLHLLLEQSLRSSHKDLSLLILEEMKEKSIEIRPHYYWPLLKQASANEGEIRVCKILHHMKQMHVRIDFVTLLDYIIPFIDTLNPKDTFRLLRDYNSSIPTVFTSLVCYLLQNDRMTNTLSLFEMMKNVKIESDKLLPSLMKAYKIARDVDGCVRVLQLSNSGESCAKFLQELVNDKSFKDDIGSILKNFINTYKRYRLYISGQEAQLIEETLAFNRGHTERIVEPKLIYSIVDRSNQQEEKATRFTNIPHPREMNEEQLENHLIELESKHMNTRGVLRKLFMHHCKNNNLERVEQLQHQLDKNEIPLTFGMKAVLLEVLAHNERVDELIDLLTDMKQNHPGLQIDASKILNVAISFAKHDRVEEALKIIEKNDDAKLLLERGCWKLLNAIANSTHGHSVQSALGLLVDKKYCEITAASLGPLIHRHLLKNDVSSAVKEFKSVVERYRKTPLHRELVCRLVEMSENKSSSDEDGKSMLQDVLRLISEIHGAKQADTDLIVGYARCGSTEKLRKAWKDTDTSMTSVDELTFGMSNEMKIRVLSAILEVIRGEDELLSQSIYESLISIYYQMEAYQDAIALCDKMNSERVTVSTVSKKKLSNLLLRHGVDIPLHLKS